MHPVIYPLLVAALFSAATAAAQGWPARPLKLIVAEGGGGAPDAAARSLAVRLAPALGQQILVSNLPETGAEAAARAKPDGYTYLIASASQLVIDPYLVNILSYSPEDDFAPVAMVGTSPFALAAIAQINVRSISDLIALAKAEPGKLALVNPGKLTLAGMLGDLLRVRTGVSLRRVPFNDGRDLLAGRTHLIILPVPAIAPAVRRGQLRALAVTTATRVPLMPEIATIAQSGFPGFQTAQWYGVLVPKGTPRPVIRVIHGKILAALKDPDVSKRMFGRGYIIVGSSPAEFKAFLKSEVGRLGALARNLGLKAN